MQTVELESPESFRAVFACAFLVVLTLVFLVGCAGVPETHSGASVTTDDAGVAVASRRGGHSSDHRKVAESVASAVEPVLPEAQSSEPTIQPRRHTTDQENVKGVMLPQVTSADETGDASPVSPQHGARPRSEPSLPQAVDDFVKLLRSKETADATFRRLWEMPVELIPKVIEQVRNPTLTAISEMHIITFDRPAQVDPEKDQWVYYVQGMGGVKFDDISSGRLSRRKAFKVVLKRKDGFIAGDVFRAALLNRLRSPKYPRNVSDVTNPKGWFARYWQNVRAKR